MKFYLLDRPPRSDGRVPLDASDEYPGCIIVNCKSCGVTGALPHGKGGKVQIEIVINDVAYLDDIEQAFTTLLVSNRFREYSASRHLTGIEFYEPVGYQCRTKMAGSDEMIRRCRQEYKFNAIHVTGCGGSIATTSNVRLQKACPACGWEEWTLPENGIFVDQQQWDGSDFFYVDEFGAMLMSQNAVNALREANLSNFGAQSAEDYRIQRVIQYSAARPENQSFK